MLKKTMKKAMVIDGRNIYEKKEVMDVGIYYFCIGK